MSHPTCLISFVGTVHDLRVLLIPAIERVQKNKVVRCPACYAICENEFEKSCILKNGTCTECYELGVEPVDPSLLVPVASEEDLAFAERTGTWPW